MQPQYAPTPVIHLAMVYAMFALGFLTFLAVSVLSFLNSPTLSDMFQCCLLPTSRTVRIQNPSTLLHFRVKTLTRGLPSRS